jgi:hypothetical protein
MVVEKVGFMPLSPAEANLFFRFVSSMSAQKRNKKYEKTG